MATEVGKYGFRIRTGMHRENKRSYRKGDVVVTNAELDVLHNSRLSTKFERLTNNELLTHLARVGADQVPESTSQATANSLEKMTIEELKAHAADEEIDLKGVKLTDKKAIIAAIIAGSK